MPKPKLDAIGVTSESLTKTTAFYSLLGFEFADIKSDDQHIEAITGAGEVRLMIDDSKLAQSLIGQTPTPPNHSMFAMLCASPAEVDAVASQIADAGFVVIKEPWDAFWGQRYATVADPDGYMVDLFAPL
ncbi:MAG: VOC family protein [Marinosulfonomonas sp.]|nr:VOC family protein [Marinosulfonomonas sp.]